MSMRLAVVLPTAAPDDTPGEVGGAFVKIDGRESLLRCVEMYVNREGVEQVIAVVSKESADDAKRKFGPHFSLSGVKLLTAGAKWFDQLATAAEKLSADATHVVIHDGARPAVPYSDVDALLEEAASRQAVALSAPLRSSIVAVDAHGDAKSYASASDYMQLLSPHVYTRKAFLKMVETKKPLDAFDLYLVKGSPLNVRVGGSGDEKLVKALLTLLPKPKIKGPTNPFEEAQW
jgi:2-C-methyl-D-erythritol 4-phosphate cytidylyltransferase